MRRINIMTSCDNGLVKYILPQLVSIDRHTRDYEVHFYFAHSRVPTESLNLLEDFIKSNTSIIYHEARVTEHLPFFESLVVPGGRQWPQEAYFTLRPQDYLPEDIDRVLYIDAGDVIIDGDIAPYYFADFEGKSIIATALAFKTDPVTNKPQLYTHEDILTVAHSCLFNSGCFIINLENFRNDGYSVNDYLYLAELLASNSPHDNLAYFSDQGFLAAAFVGDVKIFDYPEHADPSYMPYNFRTSYWGMFKKKELPYTPIVLHYAIISKPWVVRFTEEVINTIIDKPDFVANHLYAPIPPIAYMTPQHLRMGEVWWEYAKETPIYEEASLRATITAESWIKHYLPMCTNYINTFLKLKRGE